MYQQQKKTPFCALTMYLRSTGNKAPKYEYKADAKSLFTCSLTKKNTHYLKLMIGIVHQRFRNFIMLGIEVNGWQRHKKLKILTNMIKVICK